MFALARDFRPEAAVHIASKVVAQHQAPDIDVLIDASDIYGPNDPRPKLIALLVRMLKTGEAVELTPEEQTINFCHVDDVVAAIKLALAQTNKMACPAMDSFAIRGAGQMTLRAFVELFGQIAGTPLNVACGAKSYRSREVMTPWLGELLPGWRAEIPIYVGLRRLLAGV